MNKYSNKQKATAGVCVIALVHLLVCTISPPSDFENAFVLTNLIMGLCWVLELMVIFAPKSISDMIVDQSTQLWEWLKKECKELKIGSPKDSNPPFNRDVTANVVSEVLLEVSNENKGIEPVRRPADIKWRMIRKNGIWFMRFSVMRNGSAPLSEEEVQSLCVILQRRISNLLTSEYYNLIPVPYYGGNQWDIITVDEVKQSGVDILIDVIWVQDQRVADYLYQKHFGAYIDNTSDAPPADEDFRND